MIVVLWYIGLFSVVFFLLLVLVWSLNTSAYVHGHLQYDIFIVIHIAYQEVFLKLKNNTKNVYGVTLSLEK